MTEVNASKFKTRAVFTCPLFGAPQEFKQSRLPTYEDVLRCCFQERCNLAPSGGNKEPNFSIISENVAEKVEKLYIISSIPTVSHTRVVQMICKYHATYRSLMKPYKQRKDICSYKIQTNKFLEEAKKTLFDIAACKCKHFSNCACEKSKKVPTREQGFLQDQRTQRLGYIGTVDSPTTQVLQRRVERRDRSTTRTSGPTLEELNVTPHDVLLEGETELPNCDDITDYKPRKPTPSTSQMRINLPVTATIIDRFGLPDRAAAAVTSAVLQDFGVICKEDPSHVIDKNKIRRERAKARSNLQETPTRGIDNSFGIYFDGRKDKTLRMEKEGEKFYRRSITEEHISVILEPGSQYFGHLSPSSGTALSISQDIATCMAKNGQNPDHLTAVGCDGTCVNTGSKGGVIRLLEEKFEKPLQWLCSGITEICVFN